MAIAIIRTLILYFALIISMRIMGKRQLGQLEPAELVIAVLISDLAAHPLQDVGTPLLYGLIPVITLLCCEVLISAGIIKSLKLRTFICGKPSIIIDNGKIVQTEMKKNRLTLDELTEDLRKKSILDIATVKYAILETDGTLSTLLFPAEAPVTPKQMNVKVDDNGYPVMVINNGRVLDENLNKIGYNDNWLRRQLKNRNISEANDVYMMSVDSAGQIYFALKEQSK